MSVFAALMWQNDALAQAEHIKYLRLEKKNLMFIQNSQSGICVNNRHYRNCVFFLFEYS